MKEKKNKTIQEMWKNPRQKAIIKLGAWFCFFILIAIVVSIMNQFSKSSMTTPTSSDQETTPINKKDTEFLNIEELWKNLEEKDYNYSYQIVELETQEKTTYNGEKKGNTEEGYRESKLGIIKYRIREEKTYQIFLDTEEEIEKLYEEEDIPFLKLDFLYKKIQEPSPQENIIRNLRYLTYETEDERIVITTSEEEITSITITTNTKSYKLEFEMEKE